MSPPPPERVHQGKDKLLKWMQKFFLSSRLNGAINLFSYWWVIPWKHEHFAFVRKIWELQPAASEDESIQMGLSLQNIAICSPMT